MSQKELGKKDNVSLDDALKVLNNERHTDRRTWSSNRGTPWQPWNAWLHLGAVSPLEDPGNSLSIFPHKIVISDTRLLVAFRLGDAQWTKSLLHKHADLSVGPWHRVRPSSSV